MILVFVTFVCKESANTEDGVDNNETANLLHSLYNTLSDRCAVNPLISTRVVTHFLY